MGIVPVSEHEGVLRPLCKRLADLLEQGEDIEPRLPAVLQALSSIGRVAPHIFAEHAAAVADFVLHVRTMHSCLCAEMHAFQEIKQLAFLIRLLLQASLKQHARRGWLVEK